MRTTKLLLPLLIGLPALAQGEGSVPTAVELAAAQPAAIQAMAERIAASTGGDHGRATSELLAAGYGSDDRAIRYLLFAQAVALAERVGDAQLALMCDQHLANAFELDPARTGVAVLRRMAAAAADEKELAGIAMTALRRAGEYAPLAERRPVLAFYDLAVRYALRADDGPLYAFVRDGTDRLRAPVVVGDLLRNSLVAPEQLPWPPATIADQMLAGAASALDPLLLREIAPLLDGFGDIDPERPCGSLTAAELIELSARARLAEVRRGLMRCARSRLIQGYADDGERGRRTRCEQLVHLTEQLAVGEGVCRLRFARDKDLDRLALANGRWRVVDGLLEGASTGASNFATHRVRFASMQTVVIRGGIRSAAGLNFRCQVGDVNLLLNWEVEPQNHLWLRGACHRLGPPALTAGVEHTILVFTDGSSCHVAVDGNHLWTVAGDLSGTVSVYPALGSEIFVREILIDGDPDGLVDAPIGVLM